MNLRIVGPVVIGFLLIATVGLCFPRFNSPEDISKWMTFYYQKTDSGAIPAAIEYVAEFAERGNSRFPDVALPFFSAVFKGDAAAMTLSFDRIATQDSDASRIFMARILYMTNTSQSRLLLKRAKKEWISDSFQKALPGIQKSSRDLVNDPIDNPHILDALWAAFFATGDDIPVKRIISVIHLEKDGRREREIVLGGVARWSVWSNASQHSRVFEICKSERAKTSGTTRAYLEQLIRGDKYDPEPQLRALTRRP